MKGSKETHRAQTITGLRWSLLDKVFSQGMGFLVNIILARLLLPGEFGLIGMVIVIIGFAEIFKDFGLGSAIIQKKEVTDDDLSSVFWFNFLIGIVLTGIIYFSASYVANFYDIPLLQPITELLSITYFIGALNIVQLSLLRKRLDFKKIFVLNVVASFVSGILAIGLAFNGWGVWSLVWKMIVVTIISNIILWLGSGWRPKFRLSKESLAQVMKFSMPLLGTQSLNYWVRNADNLLIGKYLGSDPLGFYSQSYRIMLVPVGQISGVVSNVLFPALAQIQDDKERIKAIYLKSTQMLSFITFPLMFGLSALAYPFVEILLGPKWLPMAPVLQYLSIVGALQSINRLNGNIYLATGKTLYQFWVGIPPRILYIVAIVYGLGQGIEGVAFWYTMSVIVATLFMYYFVGKVIKLSFGEIAISLSKNIITATMMAFLMWTCYFYSNIIIGSLGGLLISCVLGIVFYLVAHWLFNKKFILDMINFIKDRRYD